MEQQEQIIQQEQAQPQKTEHQLLMEKIEALNNQIGELQKQQFLNKSAVANEKPSTLPEQKPTQVVNYDPMEQCCKKKVKYNNRKQ